MHQDIFGGRSTHSWKDERNREESGSRRGGRDQLPDADIQTERQSVGLFRGVQESHRILSDTLRCRSLQERTVAVQEGKGFGPISNGSAHPLRPDEENRPISSEGTVEEKGMIIFCVPNGLWCAPETEPAGGGVLGRE